MIIIKCFNIVFIAWKKKKTFVKIYAAFDYLHRYFTAIVFNSSTTISFPRIENSTKEEESVRRCSRISYTK